MSSTAVGVRDREVRGEMLAGLLVGAIAVAANLWMLGLSWQIDEVLLVPRAGAMLGLEAFPDRVDDVEPHAAGLPLGARTFQDFMFRPVLWSLWWVLLELGGGLADPVWWHAVMLGFHGLAAVVLRRVLRVPFGGVPATIGAAEAWPTSPRARVDLSVEGGFIRAELWTNDGEVP